VALVRRRWSALVGPGRPWLALVGLGWPWLALVGPGRPWSALVGLGWPWSALVGPGRLGWPWSARPSGSHRCRHQRVDLRDRVQHLRCARCGAEVGYDLRDGSGGLAARLAAIAAAISVSIFEIVYNICVIRAVGPKLDTIFEMGRGAGRPSGSHRCRHQRVDLRDRVQHLRHTRCGAEVGYNLRDGSGGPSARLTAIAAAISVSACRSSRSCTTSASYALWGRSWIQSSRWVGGLAARLAAIAAAISVSIFEIVYNICVIRAVGPKLDTIFEMGRGRLGNVENTSEL
jgi:hypothetical protein